MIYFYRYLNIVIFSEFGRSETNAKLKKGYDFLYSFIKLQATSYVLNSVLIPSMQVSNPQISKTLTK